MLDKFGYEAFGGFVDFVERQSGARVSHDMRTVPCLAMLARCLLRQTSAREMRALRALAQEAICKNRIALFWRHSVMLTDGERCKPIQVYYIVTSQITLSICPTFFLGVTALVGCMFHRRKAFSRLRTHQNRLLTSIHSILNRP